MRTTLGLAQVNQQHRSHALAVSVSLAVHLAAGAALLWPQPSAPMSKVSDHVMTVSLIAPDAGRQGAPVSLTAATVDPVSHPDPNPATTQAPQAEGSAQKAMAKPSVAAAADEGVTLASASASRHSDDTPAFQQALLTHIEQFRRYPDEARRNQKQGILKVGFTMDRKGNLIDLWIEQSSGIDAIDEEVLATIRRALPLPLIPPNLPDPLNVVLPVSFALH
jgi:protein TonB